MPLKYQGKTYRKMIYQGTTYTTMIYQGTKYMAPLAVADAPTITSVSFDSINNKYLVESNRVTDATSYQLWYYYDADTSNPPTQNTIETNAVQVDSVADPGEAPVEYENGSYEQDVNGNREPGYHCHIVRGCNTEGCGPWSTAHTDLVENGGGEE